MNKTITTVLLLLAFLFSQNKAVAQHKNSLDINIGLNQGYFQDRSFSPLNYKESGTAFSLQYLKRRPSNKNLFSFKLKGGFYPIKTSISERFIPNLLAVDLTLGYLRNISAANQPFNLFVGASYQSKINFVDFGGLQSFTYLFAHGLNAQVMGEYAFNDRHSIQSTLSIPIAQILARPVYNGHDKFVLEDFEEHILAWIFKGKLTSLNRYFSIDWETKYHFQLSRKVDLTATYAMLYQHLFDDSKWTQLQNQIRLGVAFKFGRDRT